MKSDLTVIIPCRDERSTIVKVIHEVDEVFQHHNIFGSILVVDDHSTPPLAIGDLWHRGMHVKPNLVRNPLSPGLASAFKTGVYNAYSPHVIFMSGDGTDDPAAIPLYYRYLMKGYFCVFGQRRCLFRHPSKYPVVKFFLNRLGNRLISLFFDRSYSDYTDIFKGYFLTDAYSVFSCKSMGYGISLELCLRAILSNRSYKVFSIKPRARVSGRSKFRLWHDVPDYFLVLLRCLKLKYGKKNY